MHDTIYFPKLYPLVYSFHFYFFKKIFPNGRTSTPLRYSWAPSSTALFVLSYRCELSHDLNFFGFSSIHSSSPGIKWIPDWQLAHVSIFAKLTLDLSISEPSYLHSILFAPFLLKTTNRSCTSHFEAGAGERSITLSNLMIIFGLKTRKLKRLKWLRKSASSNIWD